MHWASRISPTSLRTLGVTTAFVAGSTAVTLVIILLHVVDGGSRLDTAGSDWFVTGMVTVAYAALSGLMVDIVRALASDRRSKHTTIIGRRDERLRGRSV